MTIPFSTHEATFWRKTGGIINPRQGESIGPLTLHEASVNPHGISLTSLVAGTLASLNANITDATLDDISNPRPSKILTNQPLFGVQDSINKVYTTGATFKSGSTRLYVNGLQQDVGIDYDEVGGNGVTFTGEPAPKVSDTLSITFEEP